MIRRPLKDLYQDRAGATSIEYAIIGSSIAIVIVAGMSLLGSGLAGAFERTAALFPG